MCVVAVERLEVTVGLGGRLLGDSSAMHGKSVDMFGSVPMVEFWWHQISHIKFLQGNFPFFISESSPSPLQSVSLNYFALPSDFTATTASSLRHSEWAVLIVNLMKMDMGRVMLTVS
jgi:hypothetical protein